MQRSPKCLQPIGNRPTLLRSPEDENKKAKGEDSPVVRSCPLVPESCICSGIAAGKPQKGHQDKAKDTRDSRQNSGQKREANGKLPVRNEESDDRGTVCKNCRQEGSNERNAVPLVIKPRTPS